MNDRSTVQCQTDPFPHLQFREFFTPEEYRGILENLPPLEACHELRHRDAIGQDNKSTRLQFGFAPHEWHKLENRHFWADLLARLAHPNVTESVRKSLKPGMVNRFGDKWESVKLKPVPWILRDQTGYRIGIHPDHLGKIITLQVYLPKDDSQKGLGTTLYKQVRSLSKPKEPGHPADPVDQDKFDPVVKLDFLPNMGYAFVVQPDSWHGVDPVEQSNGLSRDSLMIHYVQG